MDGYHHRGGDDLQPDRPRARLALARPQQPATGWGAGHARSPRRSSRLVRQRRSRLHPWRTVAGPRDGSSCARRDGRGGRYQGSDPCGAAAITTNRQRRRCVMMFDYLSYLLLIVVVVMFLAAAIRILREYERGVVFTLGRFTGVKGPGLIILIPFVQQMVKVDLRVVVQDVPPQDVITRDNVTVKVNAVLTSASSTRSERSSRSLTLWPRQASWRKLRCAPSSANTSSTNCWRNAIGSTLTFRRSSISRPTPGVSR